MKKSMLMLGIAVAISLNAAETPATPPAVSPFTTDAEKIGYAFGMQAGQFVKRMKDNGYPVDMKRLHEAIDDYVNNTLKQSETEGRNVVRAFGEKQRAEAANKNKAEGEKFLAENKSKDGVVTLPSGLQYQVIKDGTGASPKADDTVSTHYRGTLIDGTEFDSSYSRGMPAEFPVQGVIPGWTEALQKMKVGSKWKLFIPSNLAYGERGGGQKIGPHATLLFDIELLSIKSKVAEPAAAVTSDIIKVPSADELKKGAQVEVIKASDVERIQKEAAEAAKKAADKK